MLIELRNSFWYIRVTLTFSNSNMKTRKGSVHSDIRIFQWIVTIVIFCHREKTCDVSVTLTLPCIAGAFRLAPKDCYHGKYIIDLPIGVEMVNVHIIVTLSIILLQKKRICGVTLPGVILQRWKGRKRSHRILPFTIIDIYS